MIVTEAEAKDKWCPEVRVHAAGVSTGVGINAYTKLEHADLGDVYAIIRLGNCIGSECMLWHWITPSNSSKMMGYCGKAGRPPT